MNYWYVARPNELFLDIDNVSRSIKHARARLQGAIECGKLEVKNVLVRQSKTANHIHAIVSLSSEYGEIQRAIWAIILHSDIYRGCATIYRSCSNIPCPDILISPYGEFNNENKNGKISLRRWFDDKCDCASKHNAATMETCPAAKRLRGEFRNAGFFGKPSKNPCTIWPDL